MAKINMEELVALCKRRGFIFQSYEIYGGLNGCWDYGDLGSELKNNLKQYWRRVNIQERDDIVALDGSILAHQKALSASGHVGGFSDPMTDCKTCKGRFRADSLDEYNCPRKPSKKVGANEDCQLTKARDFNLMFKTKMGATADENDPSADAYLRPETAQSIFCQFKNTLDTTRQSIPFGIAQIGKAFRNEINPRNFTFRSREFEQMEIEYFCHPEDGLKLTDEWLETRLEFYQKIGLSKENLRVIDVPADERAHYSQKTYDIQYHFPFGWQELEGVAYRGDYDLRQHKKHSGKKLEYFDPDKKISFLPHVVEPSAGVDRTCLALICEAYEIEEFEQNGKQEKRNVMRFSPVIAPIKCAVMPLLKNKESLRKKAREIHKYLRKYMRSFYDESGAIGRRYRRQDECGTPFCITVDFDTVGGENTDAANLNTVTIRERDSMKQKRVDIKNILSEILPQIS